MSRDDFPDRGSRPRTASAGAAREGSGEPLEQGLGQANDQEGGYSHTLK